MATISVFYDGKKLLLPDKGNTTASWSEQINWHPVQGVPFVKKVKAKPTSPISTAEFWSDVPKKDGVNFRRKISSEVEGAWVCYTTCDVGTNGNEILVTEDPRIQVPSR